MKYTLKELSLLTQSTLYGDPDCEITGVATLEGANCTQAAFLENSRYEKQLENSQAGVVLIHASVTPVPERNFLITPSPSLAFQKVIELFIHAPRSGFEGIHPSAVIHKEAVIGENVTIGPHAVIDRGVILGPKCVIGAGVFIGAETHIGSECHFHANVTIREGCEIGNRVVIQPGAVIGSEGFGYFTDNKGKHTALKQVGNVVVEDDVEIGANTTIDRARFHVTRIRRGTKIDNLVQIAHQVELGEDNLIVSQVGIAGSTKTGRNVVMGGQVGVAGHLAIADGVLLAARAGVSKSLLEPGAYSGAPAIPIKECNAQIVSVRNLGKLAQRLKDLESKLAQLESK